MNPLLIGIAVVLVLVLVWWMKRPKVGVTPTGGITTPDHPAVLPPPVTMPPSTLPTMPPATTPPSTATPPPIVSTGTVASADIPPAVAVIAPAGIKRIRVIKDTSMTPTTKLASGADTAWRTFQIGEIYAYSDNQLLKRGDFSDAQYVNTPAYNAAAFPAWNAVDDDLKTFTHTGGDGGVHILELTLAVPRAIQKVDVFNRQDCCQSRLDRARLQLFDEAGNNVFDKPLTSELQQTFMR